MSIKAIMVDDESHVLEGLTIKLNTHCPQVEIVAQCNNVKDAVQKIRHLNPDLLFLDVQLGSESGFSILDKVYDIKFETIFVTGYNEYSIRAMRAGALDYILKPIDVEELKTAVAKAQQRIAALQKVTRRMVPVAEGRRIIILKDVLYCRAADNHTQIRIKDETRSVMVPRLLGNIEKLLPSHQFMRIHNSHIVNLCEIKSYINAGGGGVIMTDDFELSVSNANRQELLRRLANPLTFCDE